MVAEGIEDGEQHRTLQAMGCEYGQGFHFSRPVPAAVIGAMLRDEHTALVR
jgi:EAL domain-containing protein (putative c-di-GMP-specific phosphodiesterase class I)